MPSEMLIISASQTEASAAGAQLVRDNRLNFDRIIIIGDGSTEPLSILQSYPGDIPNA